MTFSEINQAMKNDGFGVFSRITIMIVAVVGGMTLFLLFLLSTLLSGIKDRKRKHYIHMQRRR